jgi:quinohemoprotein ethanol dehydrogenase
MALRKQAFLKWTAAAFAVAALAAYGLRTQVSAATAAMGVTAARLTAAAPGEWLGYGRDYGEQHYSPLAKINVGNVKTLGLTWSYDFGEREGLEATPVVANGVIYVTTDFSEVWAFDARTGKKLWSYDPHTRYWQINTCCSPGNRGVAIWHDKVYVGALDGRLIALNAKTGKVAWSAQTFPKTTRLSITGAPRVIKGLVMIGNGGAELGARGVLSAYDAETGKLKWKFYLVPGKTDHDGAASDSAMKIARPTWKGDVFYKYGGGGTPWDGMAYDPDLDLLYIGAGNGSPWNAQMRSPGGGDNLFLGSIVAVRPETGQYVWHFQETPGDSWDFTSTQPIILADIKIDGKVRKTLLHAPKNGFFYVLDRATGKFIQGKAYGYMNWATGLTPEGRPIENPLARYGATGKPFVSIPGAIGAHDWQPMSFSPKTGLVYIPQHDATFTYKDDKTEGGTGRSKLGFNTGAGAYSAAVRLPSEGAAGPNANKGLPGADTAGEHRDGFLLAWDPVKQQARFKIPMTKIYNGGILSTGGNLVFEGTSAAEFAAYRDDTGQKLWSFPAQAGVMASPVSYELDGVQYVAVMAGWGGSLAAGARNDSNGPSHLLVFKLGAHGQLAPVPPYEPPPIDPPAQTETASTIDKGAAIYGRLCVRCHGGNAAGGGLGLTGPADLRRTPFLQDQAAFDQVVIDGALLDRGMAPFKGEVDADKAKAIRAYIVYQATAAKKSGAK